MSITFGASSLTSRRRLGSSLQHRSSASFVRVVFSKLFVSVAQVILHVGRTRSLQSGMFVLIQLSSESDRVCRYYMLVNSSEWGPMIQNLELQPLCNLILERTINDPDKYQSGLTKIFFRAGMLAALESLRSGRLNRLVTIVQKNMRRKMAVKKYQELRRATIKIQTWWRGIMARRFVDGVRRTAAATRLQAAVRRFIQRSNFLNVRNAVVRFQSRKSWFIGFDSLTARVVTD